MDNGLINIEKEDGELSDDEEIYIPNKRPYVGSKTNGVKNCIQTTNGIVQTVAGTHAIKTGISMPTRAAHTGWTNILEQRARQESMINNVDNNSYEIYRPRISIAQTRPVNIGVSTRRTIVRKQFSNTKKLPPHGSPVYLPKLILDPDDSDRKVVIKLSKRLNETNIIILERLVSTIDRRRISRFYNETQRIEKKGGILILSQKRRRTSGGVFLYIVKTSASVSDKDKFKIFGEDLRDVLKAKRSSTNGRNSTENFNKKDDDAMGENLKSSSWYYDDGDQTIDDYDDIESDDEENSIVEDTEIDKTDWDAETNHVTENVSRSECSDKPSLNLKPNAFVVEDVLDLGTDCEMDWDLLDRM